MDPIGFQFAVVCFTIVFVAGLICVIWGFADSYIPPLGLGLLAMFISACAFTHTFYADAQLIGDVRYELRDNPDGTRTKEPVWAKETK